MEQSIAQMPQATTGHLGEQAVGAGGMKSLTAWPTVRLGELLLSAESGFACGKSKLVADGLLHLRPFNIGRGLQIELSEQYLVPYAEAPIRKRDLLPGDILFNNTNSAELVGKAAFVSSRIKAGFSNHLTRIRIALEQAEPEFVAHYLNHLWLKGWFSSQCVQWVNQAAFNTTAIKAIEIPLPPLEEQRRIVAILNHAASIRRLREQARAKAREIIPALFVEMFGDPATNPKGWPMKPLGKVLKMKSGKFLPASEMDSEGTFPVYGGNGINGYHSEYLFEAPVVVIGRVGAYCGNIHLTQPKCWVTDNALYVADICAPLTLPYLTEALRLARLNKYANQFGQPLISVGRIKNEPVLIPPDILQKEFAERVAEIEGISSLKHCAALVAEQMAQSLLDQVFGQVA